MKPKIKICGMKNQSTIELCESLKVDYLGFNLIKESPRFVDADEFEKLIASINSCLPVLVVKYTDISEFKNVIHHPKVHALQVYFDNEIATQEVITSLNQLKQSTGKKIIFPTSVLSGFEDLKEINAEVDYFLFDTTDEKLLGGTGKIFDWKLLNSIAGDTTLKPFFVAGGLNPENIEELLKVCSPYAVDVASGVEKDGVKDPEKIKQFVLKICTKN